MHQKNERGSEARGRAGERARGPALPPTVLRATSATAPSPETGLSTSQIWLTLVNQLAFKATKFIDQYDCN